MPESTDSHTETDDTNRIKQIINRFADQLDESRLQLETESAGVAQAIDALRQALDQTEECLRDGQYEEVANLGYRDVCSAFIFLQRTMGAIHATALIRSSVISDIGGVAKLEFESIEPHVTKWFEARELKFPEDKCRES